MSTAVYRIGWHRGDATQWPPVAVEAIGYPYPDADGFVPLKNTHFATEREAWQALLTNIREVEAMSKRVVDHREQQLAMANAHLREDALRREQAERAFAEWERTR